jgi:hypothetical protein
MKDSTMYDSELFCINDLTCDCFWSGGNSWGIDHCPECGGIETIFWKNLTFFQKIKAKIKLNKKERINRKGKENES